jgi:hypothetical protein
MGSGFVGCRETAVTRNDAFHSRTQIKGLEGCRQDADMEKSLMKEEQSRNLRTTMRIQTNNIAYRTGRG